MTRSSIRILLSLSLIFGAFVVAAAQTPVWRAITPAELEMKTPRVEPDADAEALFWEVRLDNKKTNRMTYEHYVRIKLFTVRGREKFSKMDIPFTKGIKIEDIAARVTKPDGSATDLKTSDIFEREIVKSNKRRILVKSFAIPGVEPGTILEYQYKETLSNDSADGERLIFQRDIPMQRVSYYVRPSSELRLHPYYFNMQETTFVPDRDGFVVATVHDVPSFAEEPLMPPADEVRKWVYLAYDSWFSGFAWVRFGFQYQSYLSEYAKPSKDIKRKADELTAGAATDDEKVRRVYAFVQKQIRNTSYDRTMTDEQREKVQVKDANDALRRGYASEWFVDILFASLVKAAGFDVRLVYSGNRSENFFTPEKHPSRRFVHIAGLAVQIGGKTVYLDPGVPYLPYGSVLWYEEVIGAMVIGEKSFGWKTIPLTPYEKSLAKRTGKFTLSEDGTLEGRAKVEYFGQQAIVRRQDYYFDSPDKRIESFKTAIRSRFAAAEISSLSISDFDDNEKPLTYEYDIKIPNYAQKTGKRIFLQPGYFEYGVNPVFSSATRKNNIYFDYPWSEDDNIEIRLPPNFTGDGITSPAPVTEAQNLGSLEISVSTISSKDMTSLIYKRQFHFGGGGSLLFSAKAYQPIKLLFDNFSKADSQTVTLKSK